MGEAILNGKTFVVLDALVFKWLQKEMLKRLSLVRRRCDAGLRNDELEFVSTRDDNVCTGLGAHAHPIDASGYLASSVGLNGDQKPTPVQLPDQFLVQLQKRFTTRAYNEGLLA